MRSRQKPGVPRATGKTGQQVPGETRRQGWHPDASGPGLAEGSGHVETESFLQSDGLNPPPRPRCGADSSQAPWPDHSPAPLTVTRSSRTVAAAAPEPGAPRPAIETPPSPPSMLAGAGVMPSQLRARPDDDAEFGRLPLCPVRGSRRVGGSALCWTEPACGGVGPGSGGH